MAISAVNGCDHCIAAHSYVATTFTKPDELALNRKGTSSDPKRAVAIGSAKSLIEKRGKVTDQDLDAVRAAGHTDSRYSRWLPFLCNSCSRTL